MTTLGQSARVGLLGVVATVALVHCGGPDRAQPDDHADGSALSTDSSSDDRFTAEPTLAIQSVDVTLGEPLAEAFERARQAYLRENIETFDPLRAYATSAARDFAWYFTANDPNDAWGRTQHVFFVVTEPWTDEHTRSFLLSYVVMPGAVVGEVGRPWFTFYSAEPVPWAVRYIFSNTAPGALEAAILSDLGAVDWSAERAPQLANAAISHLERLDLAEASELAPTCPPALDRLYSSLPRPPVDAGPGVFGVDYEPEGTLATIGLLLGESIRTELAGAAEWEADDDRVYPRLRVRDVAEGILRPIPVMIEFYLSDADVLPSEYCHRVLENISG